MFPTRWLAAATLVATLGAGQSAAALTVDAMQAVFTGVLQNTSGDAGLLGQTGSLNGLAYTLTYVYLTDRGTRTTTHGSTGAADYLTGGALVGGDPAAPPILSATLTVGTTSVSFAGSYYSNITASAFPTYGTSSLGIDAQALVGSITTNIPGVGPVTHTYYDRLFQSQSGDATLFPASVDTPFTLTDIGATNTPSNHSAFAIMGAFDGVNAPAQASGALYAQTVSLSRITVDLPDPPAPVPLPAASGLLLAALGGAAALRRRA